MGAAALPPSASLLGWNFGDGVHRRIHFVLAAIPRAAIKCHQSTGRAIWPLTDSPGPGGALPRCCRPGSLQPTRRR